MNVRHWFHCTVDDHGDRWVAQPRHPAKIVGEPTTPRLCVCPEPFLCFAAALFPRGRDVLVYRTRHEAEGIEPQGVVDAVLTQEAWLRPPVEMMLVGGIPADLVKQAQGAYWNYLTLNPRPAPWEIKLAGCWAAALAIGATEASLAVYGELRSQRGIDHDARDWIMRRANRDAAEHAAKSTP